MSKAKVELRVAGLAAEPGLVRRMEEALSAVAGVEYAHVNLGAAKVTIEYDDSVIDADGLIAAVERAGFDATQC
jgi:copper chaperone CopZ